MTFAVSRQCRFVALQVREEITYPIVEQFETLFELRRFRNDESTKEQYLTQLFVCLLRVGVPEAPAQLADVLSQ
jgi:hypothetical protein